MTLYKFLVINTYLLFCYDFLKFLAKGVLSTTTILEKYQTIDFKFFISSSLCNIKEGVRARNRKMTHWIARSTRAGGRPKSGEGDLGPPVRFCRVRGLGKLHGLMVKLAEWLARLGSDWRELATVVEARVVMAGGGAACSRRSPVNLGSGRT
jgi:hypothetical protein